MYNIDDLVNEVAKNFNGKVREGYNYPPDKKELKEARDKLIAAVEREGRDTGLNG